MANISLCERELLLDEYAKRGVPAICWRDDSSVLFEQFHLRENTDYFIDVTLPVPYAEAELQSRLTPGWPFSERLRAVFKIDPPRRWKQLSEHGVTVSGQLRLRNHAGVLDLGTFLGTSLRAEVVCRKIGYLHEFQTLLNEVAEFHAELLLQYDSPVSVEFDLSDARSASMAAIAFQMRYVLAEEKLPRAVEELTSDMHAALVREIYVRNISEVEEPSHETLVDGLDLSSLAHGGPLKGLFRGYTPREMPVVEVAEVVDTPENRYVKYFLEECALLAQSLSTGLTKQGRTLAAREAEGWMLRIQELLTRDLWRGVGLMNRYPSNSQVLMKRRGYREIVQFDLVLRLSLTLPWNQSERMAEGLTGDIRPVSELYEYWCFFQLRRVISEICQSEAANKGSFLHHTDEGLQVRLAKGKRSRVTFWYRQEKSASVQISLFYNRRFPKLSRNLASWEGSYTATFDPDYSVSITVRGQVRAPVRHWLHFDAKYRLEKAELSRMFHDNSPEILADADDDEVGYEQELTRLHRREDLFKMHTYRDGVLGTRGAYILFPGDGVGIRIGGKTQNFFVRNPAALSGKPAHSFPSVGAFDLCPGRGHSQLIVLRDFLNDVFSALAVSTQYQEETALF